jgi:dethiobiotin synthetase
LLGFYEFATQFLELNLNSTASQFFITAIGTDSGKTLCSAVLTHLLHATYWKPIQCGGPTDSDWIKSTLGQETNVLPERFFLKTPASPHFAAQQEGLRVCVNDFELPNVSGPLIIEGAGGLMVPLNEQEVLADLVSHFQLPVLLVVNHYLGALNHSLLTISELERRKIPIAGIIFNGFDFQDAERIILEKSGAKCLLRIPKMDKIDLTAIGSLAKQVNWNGL